MQVEGHGTEQGRPLAPTLCFAADGLRGNCSVIQALGSVFGVWSPIPCKGLPRAWLSARPLTVSRALGSLAHCGLAEAVAGPGSPRVPCAALWHLNGSVQPLTDPGPASGSGPGPGQEATRDGLLFNFMSIRGARDTHSCTLRGTVCSAAPRPAVGHLWSWSVEPWPEGTCEAPR